MTDEIKNKSLSNMSIEDRKLFTQECLDTFVKIIQTDGLPIISVGDNGKDQIKRILSKGLICFLNGFLIEEVNKLKVSYTKEELSHIYLVPGNLPDSFSFGEGKFGGVLLSWLKYLTRSEVERLLTSAHKSLTAGGALFMITDTSYAPYFKQFLTRGGFKIHREGFVYISDCVKEKDPCEERFIGILGIKNER